MHIILTLGDQLSGSKSLTNQQVAVTLQAYWQHIRADLETKIILSGGKINDKVTNAALMEDIVRHPKKYNINAKRIPKCDLILEEKSTNICGNILHAVNKIRKHIDTIKQISIITIDSYLSQVAKTFGIVSSVYNDSAPDEGAQKYEFPIYKIIACNTLEEYAETQQVANDVYYTDKFLAECKNTMINP
ncbi:MAG: ElyC/SanA/YdcF family protein, partial [Gammaproteobacteria bacterium]